MFRLRALFVALFAFGGIVVFGGQFGTGPALAATIAATSGGRIATTVTAAQLTNGSDAAELQFSLTQPVHATAFVMANPDRVVVDLPEVSFALNAQDGIAVRSRHRRAVLVESYRFGLFAVGRSRIIVALSAPARVSSVTLRGSGPQTTLSLILQKTDRTSFDAAARTFEQKTRQSAEPAKPLVTTAQAGREVIVIDPGHGGPDMGATNNGTLEKDVTLSFAKLLASKLEATGAYQVVMTRSSDVFVPLSERVAIARRAAATLMVSIHADTLPETADVSGATVYTVSDKASDIYAAKVAAKENDADAAGGVSTPKDTADVNDILFDLTRQETRAYSHVFARTLVNYWKVAARLNKNPQRSAGFIVLRAPDVPSILLELGYLSNSGDAALLISDEWREHTTGKMVDAINSYFEQRRGPVSSPVRTAAGFPAAELHQASAKLP